MSDGSLIGKSPSPTETPKGPAERQGVRQDRTQRELGDEKDEFKKLMNAPAEKKEASAKGQKPSPFGKAGQDRDEASGQLAKAGQDRDEASGQLAKAGRDRDEASDQLLGRKEKREDRKAEEREFADLVADSSASRQQMGVTQVAGTERVISADNDQRAQMMEQMRLASERISVSNDKTSIHVQLNDQMLKDCSMTVTRADDGSLSFVFNTQASESAAFLHRNARNLQESLRREMDVEIDVRIVHGDASGQQREGSSDDEGRRDR